MNASEQERVQPGPIRGELAEAIDRPPGVVIVGGGIYGVCVALEAARCGYRPLLIERDDFGSGTSWSSHRIIHGGLRYLQNLDLPRFRDSVRERRWFVETLPELVEPLPCLMPLYSQGMKRPSTFRAALLVNAALSKLFDGSSTQIPAGRVLDRHDTAACFPGVVMDGLRGGAAWYDGRMISSERVLVCLLRRACDLGARALNHIEVNRIVVEQDRVTGVEVSDDSDDSYQIPCPVVIDCSGPSVGLRSGIDSGIRDEMFVPARAFNLVLDLPPPSESAVAVGSREPNAPTLFMVPMGHQTVAGTWHEPCDSHRPDPMPSIASIDQFLAEINAAVPGFAPTRSDVRCVWSGLLPASTAATGEPSDRALIVDHSHRGGPHGLVSVSGVKYTTARHVAERAVKIAIGPCESKAPIGVLMDPLQDVAQTPFESNQIAGWVRAMRDDEKACNLEDAVLRRSPWYLQPRSTDMTEGIASGWGITSESVSAELDLMETILSGPLADIRSRAHS